MFKNTLSLVIAFGLLISSAFAQEAGEFTIRATPADVLGADAAKFSGYISEDATITWEVYVPESYDPSNPAGIMVFAGAPTIVREPAGWLSVIADKNMIWVAARKSDNGASIHQKELLAMMSVPLIQQRYNTDDSRIYITGDGRTTGRAALEYPEIFSGAIFIGDRIWEDNAEEKVKKALDNRYVFVNRELSAAPKSGRYAYNKFKNAGVKDSKFVHINNRQRYNRPKFSQSIDYLDG